MKHKTPNRSSSLVEAWFAGEDGHQVGPRGPSHALPGRVRVLVMVAHNNDHEHDVFQITPSTGRAALWLAYQRTWRRGRGTPAPANGT